MVIFYKALYLADFFFQYTKEKLRQNIENTEAFALTDTGKGKNI